MEIKLLAKSARSVTAELFDGGIYHTKQVYRLLVNGTEVKRTDTVVTSVFGLKPETDYVLEALTEDGESRGTCHFSTDYEYVTLDVKSFGAKGDGESNDTAYIQAAVLACPEHGRVLIPKGAYRITSLFLKSHIRLELAEGARLLAFKDRGMYPVFPGVVEAYNEKEEYCLGTWEGNPLPMYAGILTGIGVEDVMIYGEGVVDGNASDEDWWADPKVMHGAFRPRTVFLSHCRNVVMQGIKLCNSPSWTVHPFFCEDMGFYNLVLENPENSPNTDGLDPESCRNVEIAGVRFSLGDDCVAVKSGKIYMGKKYKTPSENIHIRQCLMENGHGAVTVGSEMSAGIQNLVVEDCIFSHTDRGLRIKTRRGRGKDAVIDNVIFRRLEMDHVMTPFVVNCFYFCDPDGKTEYVQSRERMPVDERTPCIRKLEFEDVHAENCHVAAAYFEGLPEKKIEKIIMKNVAVSYAKQPKRDVPAMSVGVEPCSRKGIYAENVRSLELENVRLTGSEGEPVVAVDVDEVKGAG